jgi:hypothetical protein
MFLLVNLHVQTAMENILASTAVEIGVFYFVTGAESWVTMRSIVG